MKLFVGNLPWDATEEDLRDHFSQSGGVKSVHIVMDRNTNRSRGFGFVEMEDATGGNNAIQKLNDAPFKNRPLRVSAARQEQEGGPRRSAGGGGGGGRSHYGQREEGRRPYRGRSDFDSND